MYPVLFEIFGLKFHTYGVAMATAFIVAIFLASRRAPKEGLDPNIVIDTTFWIFVGTLAGGRIAFIIEHFGEYLQHPAEIIKIWKGGLVFYGGFFGAIILSYAFLRYRRAPFMKYFDILFSYTGLGYAIHRAGGCFMAGCCYGRPTDLFWGIAFRDTRSQVPRELLGVKLHPTQLYEALSGLIIFLLILSFRGRKKHDGDIAAFFLVMYGVNRFFIEFFRGGAGRELLGPLTVAQVISIVTILLGGLIFLGVRRKRGTEPSN